MAARCDTVDGCRSKLVNVVSGVPRSVLGPLLFILYSSEHFSILKNKLIGNADDSNLLSVAPSPGRDRGRVGEWCDILGMKFNANKTKIMMVSRSCTMHPQSPPLTIDATVLKESDDLDSLRVTFDSKMTFENHLRSVSRASAQKLSILRKSMIGRFLGDASGASPKSLLPVLEYFFAVWRSAADTDTLYYWTV